MKYLLVLILIMSCSSTPFVPTTDRCSIQKHYKDNVFQVLINQNPINKHFYIYKEALNITKLLATQNKCTKILLKNSK